MSQLPPESGRGDDRIPTGEPPPEPETPERETPERETPEPETPFGSNRPAANASRHAASVPSTSDPATSDSTVQPSPDYNQDPFGDLFHGEHGGRKWRMDSPASRRAARDARERSARGRTPNKRSRKPAYRVRPTRNHRGLIGGVIAVAFFLVLVLVAVIIFIEPIKALLADTPAGPQDYPGPGTGEVVFTIHSGDIGEDIATNLQSIGVIGSSKVFYKLLLSQMEDPVFMPGNYQLAEKMSAQEALDALEDPKNLMESSFVIPEGTAVKDALVLISEATQMSLKDLQAAADDYQSFGIPKEAPSLEGFLFPATYSLEPGLSAHDVLQKLVDRMSEALDTAGVAAKDRFRIVTLASIIQRESGPVPGDAAKVSRVFLNRLAEGWKLQSDATVAYGSGQTHRVETTEAERDDESNPYNTYAHEGLPVGPISNPGDIAIDAAVHPANGPWMFFVTWNLETGETIFSTTIAEHDAAVAKWQEWMRNHPGYG